MKTIRDIPHLEGVKALVRADFNVPVRNGAAADDFRIRKALPTIEYLRSKGAHVLLISHIETADGANGSLEPVAMHLKGMELPVIFIKDIKNAYETIEARIKGALVDDRTQKVGRVFLLENLRTLDGEKDNDKKFAEQLASLADIYVNEAFSASHREHASIVGVPAFLPGYVGLQLGQEITHLSKAFKPTHPFLFALGGAKFDTKLPLIEKFMEIADDVFIGGALANDALKAKGFVVGASKVSNGSFDISDIVSDPKIILPVDIVDQGHSVKPIENVGEDDRILDAGPRTLEILKGKIDTAKFILWNGPLGLYEDGYQGATLELARMIAGATARGAETIVGGGDTLAAIEELGLLDRFTFVSTGGGAMLDFLAKGTLPGIEAL